MLIGHQKQKKYLQSVIRNGALSHAYLFTGPEMIGKRTFAFNFAELVNNREIANDPDFKLISPKIEEGESKIYIEDVRKLKSFLSFKPYAGPYKIVVINDAHCFTAESANALLKVLEEPPPHSLLVLVSSVSGLLPTTIISRCEEIRFLPLSLTNIAEYVSENKKLNKEDKEFLVKISGGRVGLVKSIIDNDNISTVRKSIEDLRKLLNKSVFEKMEYAKKIHESGNYSEVVSNWLYWVSAHLATSSKNEKIVKNLLSLNQIISQPQYNHRLALENFLLNL